MLLRKSIGLTLVVIAGAALAGCSGYPEPAEPPSPLTAPEVATVKVHFPGRTEASLDKGRDIFVTKCGKCHDHANLMLIEDDRWPGIVNRMAKKAKLDDTQRDLVLEYILAVRAARKVQTASR